MSNRALRAPMNGQFRNDANDRVGASITVNERIQAPNLFVNEGNRIFSVHGEIPMHYALSSILFLSPSVISQYW